jgi:hypothetical protein
MTSRPEKAPKRPTRTRERSCRVDRVRHGEAVAPVVRECLRLRAHVILNVRPQIRPGCAPRCLVVRDSREQRCEARGISVGEVGTYECSLLRVYGREEQGSDCILGVGSRTRTHRRWRRCSPCAVCDPDAVLLLTATTIPARPVDRHVSVEERHDRYPVVGKAAASIIKRSRSAL